jgi:Protein of unknown function (DUF551).
MRGLEEVKEMRHPKYGEWISVKDKVPDEGKLVLCAGSKGGYFLGVNYICPQMNDCVSIYMDVTNARIGRNATYWMPLPEPPKE